MIRSLIVLLAAALLLAACSSEEPTGLTPTLTSTSTAQPSPTAPPISTSIIQPTVTPTPELPPPTATTIPEPASSPTNPPLVNLVTPLNEYQILPEYLPDGFEESQVRATTDRIMRVFGDPQERLLLAYPVEFFPDDSPAMQEIGLFTPDDAITEVDINGATGYLLRGGWSDETILQGPGIDPEDAVWNYDNRLTLYFDFTLNRFETVAVAIQAIANPADWITGDELVRMAESLELVE